MTIEGIILKYKFNKDIILINQIGEEFFVIIVKFGNYL